VAVAPSHYDDAPHVAELLYREHAAALRSYCRRHVGADDAEEVVQTTFLRALRALDRGERPYAERAWLITIARNVCASRATSAARRHELLDLRAIEGAAVDAPRDAVDTDLASALAALPEGQRRAFVLRAVHELTYDEIAAELDVSRAAVESWIFRARRKLASSVDDRRRRRALDLSSVAGAAKSLLAGTAVKVAAATVVAGTVLAAGPAVPDPAGDIAGPQAPAPPQPAVLPTERGHSSQAKPTPDRPAPAFPTARETPGQLRPDAEPPATVHTPGSPAEAQPSPAPAATVSRGAEPAPSPPLTDLEAPALETPLLELPTLDPPALELPTVELPPLEPVVSSLEPVVSSLEPALELPLLP